MSESMAQVLAYLGETEGRATAPREASGAGSGPAGKRASQKARSNVTELAGKRADGREAGRGKREAQGRVVAYAPQIRNRAVDVLARRLAVPAEKVLHVSAIPPRTFHRRQQLDQTLSPTESDRVLRIARIAQEAERVFGSPEKSSRWLSTEHRLLGATPLDLLATDAGTQDVEEELGRIEHGVFA